MLAEAVMFDVFAMLRFDRRRKGARA